MKQILNIILLITFMCGTKAMAQKRAEIEFKQDTINIGTFSETEPVQECVFHFTNTGTAPLIIHQAIASCGCTVPEYEKTPIQPGEQGYIKITYNGRGKLAGRFTKTISIRSNAKSGIKRLFIKGDMTK